MVDPRSLSLRELENLSRRYMQEMIPFVGPQGDVMAPDMGTTDQVMAWFMDSYSMYQGKTVGEVVTGKPVAAGGTEGRREATGLGVAYLIGKALERLQIDPLGTTAIIQGFGNVGSVTAVELVKRGIKVIGVSDHAACYHDPKGLDVASLVAHTGAKGSLAGWSSELAFDPAALLVQPCGILVPAAIERVIDAGVASRLQCRVLAEAANGPTTPDAVEVLDGRRDDVFVIPDILCNSGGVIVSYFEWVQGLKQLFWDRNEVVRRLQVLLDGAFERVMSRVDRGRIEAECYNALICRLRTLPSIVATFRERAI